MPKQVFIANKPCLRKAKNQLEKHQMGFDGEHIAETVLRKLGYKGVTLTRHKHHFDVLTAREAWEVKTVGKGSKFHQMSVKARQKLGKLAWAKRNRKSAKSMLIVVNDTAEVFVKGGLGKFRTGGMKKVAIYKDWRRDVGHGRIERLMEGKPTLKWKPMMTKNEAELWAIESKHKENFFHGTDKATKIRKEGFKETFIGSNTGNKGLFGEGFYISNKEAGSYMYGKDLLKMKIDIRNPKYFKDWADYWDFVKRQGLAELDIRMEIPPKITALLKKQGYDSIYVKDGLETILFNPEQIVIYGD